MQWTYTGCTTPKVADVPVDVTECLEPMTYGLSIDDGPNCSHTGVSVRRNDARGRQRSTVNWFLITQYYDFLKETEQKATLFYVSQCMAPEMARR